jgi:hypothetical protein
MLMGWKAFHDVHNRPFLIYADLLGASRRQAKFALLGSLLKALHVQGAYSLFPEKDVIRIAFERKEAARTFAQTLHARPTAREGGWAGQWAFVFDDLIVEKVRSLLPPPLSRAPRVPDRRRNSRTLV